MWAAQDREIVRAMRQLAGRTRWVVTDRQMLAFRAGLRVPPPLAVTSLKRRWAGHLDDTDLMNALDTYAPEQIYLSGRRVPLTGVLMAYLRPRYEITWEDPRGGRFFVRNDIVEELRTAMKSVVVSKIIFIA